VLLIIQFLVLNVIIKTMSGARAREKTFEEFCVRVGAAYREGGDLNASDKRKLKDIKQFKRNGTYPKHRILALEEIGVDMEKKSEKSENELRSYLSQKGLVKLPSKPLVRFMENLRSKYRRKELKQDEIDGWTNLDFKFTPSKEKATPKNIIPRWREVIEGFSKRKSEKDNRDDMAWLLEYVSNFNKSFVEANSYGSVDEFVLTSMKVGDIDPSECTVSTPCTSFRHTLSYFISNYIPPPNGIELNPTQSQTETGGSVYFDQEQVRRDPELHAAMEVFIDEVIPKWILDLSEEKLTLTKDELVHRISKEENLFDPFVVGVQGTNFNDGAVAITETAHPGPRRLNLFDCMGNERFSTKFNCHVYEGYSYTLSFCPQFYYYGRPTTLHPSVAQLKIHVWKFVFKYLSPVSKSCPPNGCIILTYFRMFGSMIRHHKDMNPMMAINPKINSQIGGSNVVVVSFLSSQYFDFCDKIKDENGKTKYNVVNSFLTENCSIYVMDPNEDLKYYHTTRWPKGKNNNHEVRMCITFRWLGKRIEFLGADYNGNTGNRKYTQAHHAPMKIVNKFSEKKRAAYKEAMRPVKK
jgi:hypothetical protein